MKKFLIISVVIISFLLFILNTLGKPDSIKIGLVAGLSGKYSLLGTNIKDGVNLAFDEINYKINGIPIELIQKDDKQNEEENKKAINDLIKNDVKIIIGNGTSSMTEISLDLIREHNDILLISPTSSSNSFNAKDDNFIRVQVSNNPARFEVLSKYFINKNYKNIITIHDPNNLLFSKGYISNVEKAFLKAGGKKFYESIPVTESLEKIGEKIKAKNVDVIIFATNTIDTARVLQYFKIKNIKKTILCSDWAKGSFLIEEGGKAVEDILFYTSYDNDSKDKKYLAFVERFEKRYKKKPSLFTFQSYETAKILIQTLTKDNDVSKVKENILSKSRFESLQGPIVFDKYGDVQREQFMVTVKNGKYVRLNE